MHSIKAVVVFDSKYGNTQKVAQAIASTLKTENIVSVAEATSSLLDSSNLLIVGSPTHGGRPTPAIETFLKQIPPNRIKALTFGCFDTRIPVEAVSQPWLKLVIKTIGYAAPKMYRLLRQRGGQMIGHPEGFAVEGKEGPLRQGELDRAKHWAESLVK